MCHSKETCTAPEEVPRGRKMIKKCSRGTKNDQKTSQGDEKRSKNVPGGRKTIKKRPRGTKNDQKTSQGDEK